jgi:hypothetical protein
LEELRKTNVFDRMARSQTKFLARQKALSQMKSTKMKEDPWTGKKFFQPQTNTYKKKRPRSVSQTLYKSHQLKQDKIKAAKDQILENIK